MLWDFFMEMQGTVVKCWRRYEFIKVQALISVHTT